MEDKTILLVDDDSLILTTFCEMLAKHFKTVLQASDGEEAWELFLANQPDYVVTDIEMPLMDGIELLNKIKEHSPKVPVVLVTAYDHEENRNKKADLFFAKPLRVKVLLQKLKELEEQ